MRALIALLILLAVAGCRGTQDLHAANGKAKVADTVAAVAEPIARAEIRREIAAKDLEDTAKPVAKQQLLEQRTDLADAKAALQTVKVTAQTQLDQAEGRRGAAATAQGIAEGQTRDIEAKWYVKSGRRIDAAVNVIKWSVIALILTTIISSTLKGMAGPTGIIGELIYSTCLTVWTGGTYLIGRLLRWTRAKAIGGTK